MRSILANKLIELGEISYNNVFVDMSFSGFV